LPDQITNALLEVHPKFPQSFRSSVRIASGILDDYDERQSKEYEAIWDTGATISCISPKVAKELDLTPFGMAQISTAAGDIRTNQYFVYFKLRSGIIKRFFVNEAMLSGVDVLIGLDIINHGDFSISFDNEHSYLSIRIPSQGKIDYVKQADPSDH
jgi:predicted aspartyl protease